MALYFMTFLLQAKTPEWEKSEGKISKSPPCLGGAGR